MTPDNLAAPLRIGLLHQYRLGTSGSGIYLRRLAGDLMTRGNYVSVMSHDPQPDIRQALTETANGSGPNAAWRAHTLRGAGTPVAYPRAEEPGSSLFSDLTKRDLARYLTYHVDRVTRIVEHDRLDVLHANSEIPMSYVAAMVSRRTGIPYLTVAHGSTLEYVYRCDERYQRLCRTGLREASRIVVLNTDVHARVLAVAPEVADQLRVVPPGVDCSTFRPVNVVRETPSLAFVGRISADKGAFLLVGSLPRIVAQIPGLRLVVVGDGPDRQLLERLTAALGYHDFAEAEQILRQAAKPGDEPWVSALVSSWAAEAHRPATALNVTMTGQLAPRQVATQMAAADAVVVPSLVREAFPLVVLEALASGTPPLAVDAGGLGAVLGEITPRLGEFGSLLALPADPELLVGDLPTRVAALLGWMTQSGHRQTARAQCRSLAVESYSWSRVGARVESLYREVVVTPSSWARYDEDASDYARDGHRSDASSSSSVSR